MDTSIHPFRIVVFGEAQTVKVSRVKGKRREYTSTIERKGYGFILWNADETTAARAGRSGFGSFAWYGLSIARRAALDELRKPGIQQVSIRTNQDNPVAILYKSKWFEYVGQLSLFARA